MGKPFYFEERSNENPMKKMVVFLIKTFIKFFIRNK